MEGKSTADGTQKLRPGQAGAALLAATTPSRATVAALAPREAEERKQDAGRVRCAQQCHLSSVPHGVRPSVGVGSAERHSVPPGESGSRRRPPRCTPQQGAVR